MPSKHKNNGEPKNEQQFDLSFMVQQTLSGINAVEMLKDGTEITPFEIGIGTIGELNEKFDIPIEQWKLELDLQAFLLFEIGRDRPVLVYQKSAIAALQHWITLLNVDSKIESITDLLNGSKVIGKLLILKAKNGKPDSDNLTFSRGDGKFGKYGIDY